VTKVWSAVDEKAFKIMGRQCETERLAGVYAAHQLRNGCEWQFNPIHPEYVFRETIDQPPEELP